MADGEVVETGDAPARMKHRARRPPSPRWVAVGALLVLVLAVVSGWLGYRVYQQYRADQTRALFLEAGKQGAVNLTSIDFQRANADVQRVLDSATGAFRDDFASRSVALVDVVQKTQSRSTGTVTAAGLESTTADQGRVLVALMVQTDNPGLTDRPPPRSWRMRLTLDRVGDGVKISKVDLVP